MVGHALEQSQTFCLIASGHVVPHKATCPPDTKARDGGGGELKNGTFIE